MAESFGQLVKEQRIEKGLTQQRLAELVGRSPSTVRSWERDRATPNDEEVITSLADALDLAVGALADLAGVELPSAPPSADAHVDEVESSGFASSPSGSSVESSSMAESEQPASAEPSSGESPLIAGEPATAEDPATATRFLRSGAGWGPEPVARPTAHVSEPPAAGPTRAPEPAKPYVLHTDRSADSPGPDKAEPARATLFDDEPPDPQEPPSDWEADIDLDDLPDQIVEDIDLEVMDPEDIALDIDHDDMGADVDIDQEVETADSVSKGPLAMAQPGAATEAASEVAWDDEPTQILMESVPAEVRLLGVATATAIEFVAEPRPRPAPTPDVISDADATEVISRPVVDPLPTVQTVPQATAPRRAERPAASSAQPRTQTMESGRPIGPDSYLEDPREIRGYRIRAGLTTAALIAMLIVARWAWSGFREQLGGILDTLTTGF